MNNDDKTNDSVQHSGLAVAAGSALRIFCPRWGASGSVTLQSLRWCAAWVSGEGYDYAHSARALADEARAKGIPYTIERHHRDGRVTVVESWPNNAVSNFEAKTSEKK